MEGGRTTVLLSYLLTSCHVRLYSTFSSSQKPFHLCAFVHRTDSYVVQNVLLGRFFLIVVTNPRRRSCQFLSPLEVFLRLLVA